MFGTEIIKMEESQPARFSSVFQALNYYRLSNPARARYFNPHEPERGSPVVYDMLDLRHPQRLWTALAIDIRDSLRGRREVHKRAFTEKYLVEPEGALSVEEVAEMYGASLQSCYQGIRQIRKDIEDRLVARKLLDPL